MLFGDRDKLEFKKKFMEAQKMCEYEDCLKEGNGSILGGRYCAEHEQAMDSYYGSRWR